MGRSKQKVSKYVQLEQEEDKRKQYPFYNAFSNQEDVSNAIFINFNDDIKLTPKQKEVVKLINENKVTVITGPAGTAKTFCAAYAALKLFADTKDYNKIIITKPTEIVGDSELGFTPGTVEEKLAVYMENFNDVFEDLVDDKTIHDMVSAKELQYKASQFVRGRTIKNSIVIIDEFQSFDIKTLMAIVTRIGKKNAKFIFCGDIKQNDIAKKYVAVNVLKKILTGVPNVAQFEFTEDDNMRDDMVKLILKNYDTLEQAGELTPNRKNA